MLIHDIAKMRMSNLGFLPDLPYHLISDKELFEGFLPEMFYPAIFPTVQPGYEAEAEKLFRKKPWLITGGYFYYAYPEVQVIPEGDTQLTIQPYLTLKGAIIYHIDRYLNEEKYEIPAWVYSYLLGEVIGPKSDVRDIHDLIYPLGVDNIDDEYTPKCAQAVYNESMKWLKKTRGYVTDVNEVTEVRRPPTMYGEPHVIKSIRISAVAPITSV